MNKGFSLIELLVVIGIFAVLVLVPLLGLDESRELARDDQRITDLRQVEQALQFFFLKCGFYPGSYDAQANRCQGGLLNGSEDSENPLDWPGLEKILSDAGVGFSSIPYDPSSVNAGKNYKYRVQLGDAGAAPPIPRAQCYVLGAALETSHQALNDPKELDGAPPIPGLFPSSGGASWYTAQAAGGISIDCSDPAYCIGNQECFYGN